MTHAEKVQRVRDAWVSEGRGGTAVARLLVEIERLRGPGAPYRDWKMVAHVLGVSVEKLRAVRRRAERRGLIPVSRRSGQGQGPNFESLADLHTWWAVVRQA